MAVEDHLKFPEWRAALENLIAATEALKKGKAIQADVDKARQAYIKIADEL